MADNESNVDFTITDLAEIMDETIFGENIGEDEREFVFGIMGLMDQYIETSYNQLPIPKVKYYFEDHVVLALRAAFNLAPTYPPFNLNVRLTGDDSGTKYVINFHFLIDDECQPSQNVSVSLYRIKENGEVERYNNSWESVDPELLQMVAWDTRDEAVYDLFMALENLDGRSVLYRDIEDVKDIISQNKKLLDVYRALYSSFVDVALVADETVMPAPIALLVPRNSYRTNMVLFQTVEKLVLGCVSHQDDAQGPMVIYDTDSVDRMIEVLSIIWDPDDEESESYPKLYSGGFISAKPTDE